METGEERNVRVEVLLPAHVYSRLALFAHRHEQTLGAEIRSVLAAHVKTVEQAERESLDRLDERERTITSDQSTGSA